MDEKINSFSEYLSTVKHYHSISNINKTIIISPSTFVCCQDQDEEFHILYPSYLCLDNHLIILQGKLDIKSFIYVGALWRIPIWKISNLLAITRWTYLFQVSFIKWKSCHNTPSCLKKLNTFQYPYSTNTSTKTKVTKDYSRQTPSKPTPGGH